MQVAIYINNNSIFSTLHINTSSASGGCAPRPLHLGSTTSAKKPLFKNPGYTPAIIPYNYVAEILSDKIFKLSQILTYP